MNLTSSEQCAVAESALTLPLNASSLSTCKLDILVARHAASIHADKCTHNTFSPQAPSSHTTQELIFFLIHYTQTKENIPYSRKYWQELNLAVGSQMAIAKILADF